MYVNLLLINFCYQTQTVAGNAFFSINKQTNISAIIKIKQVAYIIQTANQLV